MRNFVNLSFLFLVLSGVMVVAWCQPVGQQTARMDMDSVVHSSISVPTKAAQTFLATVDLNRVGAVNTLLKSGKLTTADLLSTNSYGENAILIASRNGSLPMLQTLLQTGNYDRIAVTRPDGLGSTPLMYAALNGQEPIAKILLADGNYRMEDLQRQNASGESVFSYAKQCKGHERMEALLQTAQVQALDRERTHVAIMHESIPKLSHGQMVEASLK